MEINSRTPMNYLKLVQSFKKGSTLPIKRQLLKEVKHKGLQPTEKFSANHNASFVFGYLMQAANENNFSFIDKYSENDKKPMEWDRILKDQFTLDYMAGLEEDKSHLFSTICATIEEGQLVDQPAFFTGLFLR